MDSLLLHGDCGRCVALCCVALPFDRSPMFAFHKAADERCSHLGDEGRCGIHHDLAGAGFSGCAAYDCHGAGQRVSAALSGEHREVVEVHRVFRSLCDVHAMAVLLRAAEGLALPAPLEAERRQVAELLERGPGATFATLESFDAGSALTVARTFLRRLQPVVAGRRLPILDTRRAHACALRPQDASD